MSIEIFFEKVWLSKGKPHMDKNQNKMQRGFTENLSCINTGFLVKLLVYIEGLKEYHTDLLLVAFGKSLMQYCQTLLLLLHHCIVGSTGSIDHLKCR
jgi:hypothetical protein